MRRSNEYNYYYIVEKRGPSMQYISALEASEKWGVSLRQVQRLLADGRIPYSKKYGRSWMVPEDAAKPVDPRIEQKLGGPLESSGIGQVIDATSSPMPSNNPDLILQTAKDERSRRQYESELAYLRGDFAHAMRCYQETEGDDTARLRASMVGVAAAISLGDYNTYTETEAYLKGILKTRKERDLTIMAELALASVAVSVMAPNMVPDWIKNGDFSAFPLQAKPAYMLYLRARYFLCIGQYEAALAIAQTTLVFDDAEKGITFYGIYLRVISALACHCLEREDEAARWLLDAMHIALPHGFLTPFAECVSDFGGHVEQCVRQAFPGHYDAVIGQWKHTVTNWISFHNRFTKDNITMMLSLREYHLAQLVARRVPYAKIAKQYDISVGRLKNIMLEIYQKLFISSRDELAKYVLILK